MLVLVLVPLLDPVSVFDPLELNLVSEPAAVPVEFEPDPVPFVGLEFAPKSVEEPLVFGLLIESLLLVLEPKFVFGFTTVPVEVEPVPDP